MNAYLFRAVYNEALRLRRRAALRRAREPVSSVALPERTEDLLPRPDIRGALLGLSVRQRAVVVLTYWLDLSPARIAKMLGVSTGTVKRHLARARAHLREVLDE